MPHERWFSFDPEAWVQQRTDELSHHPHNGKATHQLIKDNLHLTPIYGGFIDSKGPAILPLDRRQNRALCR